MLPRSFLHRRLPNVQTQRRLLSAVLAPAVDKGPILTQINGGFRALQLKRANGLCTIDCQSLVEVRRHVEWWDENSVVNVSVLSGDGENFCSGLDLAGLRGSSEKKVRESLEALCGLVAAVDASNTPAVSILDGACVGSGYALAMGKYKFATENSAFYIPEATLGLGLAGGLSHALPRLLGGNQPLALCLALTGMALEGADLFLTQLATSYMTHRRLDLMMERLAEVNQNPNPFGDKTPDTTGTPSAVETLLERSGELSWNPDGLSDDFLHETKGQVPITAFVNDVLPQVEQAFAVESVEEAIENLKGRTEIWAQMALHNIDRSSPLSLKVMFEQLKRARDMGLAECLDDEFSVNAHLFGLPDFEMAMHARESGGGTPAWKCGSLEQVSGDQVAAVFETVPRA